MKKLFLLLFLPLAFVAFAQTGNNDILFTNSGEIIQGKVVKVTASSISFSYPGETLINELSTTNLQKIVFSSGRTQNFSGSPESSSATKMVAKENFIPEQTKEPIPTEEIFLGPGVENNKLVVVPSSFTKNGGFDKDTSSQITRFATTYLADKNQSQPIEVQEMSKTISMLVDAGIGFQQLATSPIDKLQAALKAEHLVIITVSETKNQSKPKSSGFYDDAPAQEAESSLKYDIELIVYGGEGKETYSTKLSDERSYKSNLASGGQEWKTGLKYVLDQVLTSANL
ncbi:hypothetical protein [Flagellimonas allohymeniacidonis]|uniref:Uncharacterized protein n=1 Tax=Flagellimonas allohymeniacidonis TaxID=2517819 RepID=A0A4Q8QKX8_9FLAO|nr:hypothetical protein [Allomuricauda hymeniacidonis]TAI48896.1 hypothetical protein EW142_03615 [Allomuricauda hymeniacidonis]